MNKNKERRDYIMKPETKERALAAFTIESDSILATQKAMDMDAFAKAVDALSKAERQVPQLSRHTRLT